MSDEELLRKLQYKLGQRMLVINAPPGYLNRLAGLGVDTRPSGKFDFVHLFVRDSDQLNRDWPVAFAALKPEGVLWVAYPKLSSGIKSDLTRDTGWSPVFAAGFQGVRQIAIDDTWSALRFKRVVLETPAQAVDAQFAGAKSALKPIYDKILAIVMGFGEDVRINPRQTYIALARKQQFAVIKASTTSRLDLGFRLRGVMETPRLRPAEGLGSDSINYKVSLSSLEDVTDEVIGWLKHAYLDA